MAAGKKESYHFSEVFGDWSEKGSKNLPVIEADKTSGEKKRGRPKKEGTDIIKTGGSNSEPLQMYQSNVPYSSTYGPTNGMLMGAVAQADKVYDDVSTDLKTIRASKTLQKKYDYIVGLSSAQTSSISAKINAIREIDSVISKAHELDLKRAKEVQAAQIGKSDDQAIMDAYNAYINAPRGVYNIPTVQSPSMIDMSTTGTPGIVGIGMSPAASSSPVQGLNPVELRMRMDANPNMKIVVVYDGAVPYSPETGYLRFEMMNATTGEFIKGVDLPDPIFLKNLTVDKRAGLARDSNLDRTFPLIVMNDPANQY